MSANRVPLNGKGFGAVGVLIALVVLIVTGAGGWYVYSRNQDQTDTKRGASSKENTENEKQTNNQDEQPGNQYGGWQSYSNATYGISFKYPAEWKVREAVGSSSPASSDYPIIIEHGIYLELSKEEKYNTTASIEVLAQDFGAATAWYDSSQSAPGKVTKTTNQLKGKQTVQYSISNNGVDQKIYLFSVGGKTYVFSSINEELNLQTDADYWTKFGKVLDSLRMD